MPPLELQIQAGVGAALEMIIQILQPAAQAALV